MREKTTPCGDAQLAPVPSHLPVRVAVTPTTPATGCIRAVTVSLAAYRGCAAPLSASIPGSFSLEASSQTLRPECFYPVPGRRRFAAFLRLPESMPWHGRLRRARAAQDGAGLAGLESRLVGAEGAKARAKHLPLCPALSSAACSRVRVFEFEGCSNGRMRRAHSEHSKRLTSFRRAPHRRPAALRARVRRASPAGSAGASLSRLRCSSGPRCFLWTSPRAGAAPRAAWPRTERAVFGETVLQCVEGVLCICPLSFMPLIEIEGLLLAD